MLKHIPETALVVKLISVFDIINDQQLIEQFQFQYIIKEYKPDFLSRFYTTYPNPDTPYQLVGKEVQAVFFAEMCTYQPGDNINNCFFTGSDKIIVLLVDDEKYALVDTFDTPEWL